MPRFFVLLALFVGTILPLSARAQVTHDPQIWTAVLSNAKLSEGPRGPALWLDLHLRRSGANTVAIVRPGAGWRLGKSASLWAGYAWVPALADSGGLVNEHRPWQQLILSHQAGPVSLQLRTRFEQRLVSSGSDVGFRLREFARVSGSWKEDGTFGLVAWDELFLALNATDWGAQPGFDQNRVFVGAYTKPNAQLRLELGYLLLYLNRDTDTVGHVLATNLFVSL